MTTPDKFQQSIIDSKEKDIVVLAAAGSGKTFTLLQKLHKLVSENGVDPESILVLTFTRFAAMSMRERYIAENKAAYHNVPDFNTFHAFCYHAIKENRSVMNRLGYVLPPEIADPITEELLIQEAKKMSGCKISNRKLEHPENLSFKEKMQYDNFKNALDRLYRKKNCICFDNLSRMVCKLFEDNDDSIQILKNKYKYIFVDEFQDTDKEQFNFVMSMENSNRLLCGDALQNIYQFRGCNNGPLKELASNPNWKTYQLPSNYRSTFEICDYANNESEEFISKEWRIPLIANSGTGSKVNEIQMKSGGDWNKIFSQEYLDLVIASATENSGTSAVLCRTNWEVLTICKEFSKRGVMYQTPQKIKHDVNIIQNILAENSISDYIENLMEDEEEEVSKKVEEASRLQEVFESNSEYSSILTVLSQMFSVPLDSNREFNSNEELLSYVLNMIQNNSSTYIGTIHSVKGLEFDNVTIVNVDDDKFFKLNTEESQNLFYVACTRAKKNLTVLRNN